MNMQPTYAPPRLDRQRLTGMLLDHYLGHKDSRNLIEALVEEYVRFWRMFLSYPTRRVVAPGPILAVQRIHFWDRERYFNDCMDYFNRFLHEEFTWRGQSDFVGTHDTVMAYQDLYNTDPPGPWNDLTKTYYIKRSGFRVV